MSKPKAILRQIFTSLSLASVLLLSGCWLLDDGSEELQKESATPAEVKKAFGADPTKWDTDGDGLSDDFEISFGYPFLKPDSKDSNDNGVSDADEDSDGDGLSNLDEQKYGTKPLSDDSDGDGVSDGDEINKYKTDPLKKDTDDDGVADGREIENGTDPLKSDASAAITSKKTHQVYDSTTGLKESVRVEIVGPGDLSGKAIVSKQTPVALPFSTPYKYSVSLPADSKESMQSAKLTLPYNPADPAAASSDDFVVLTIDPATGFFEVLPTQANASTKTVEAQTTHFSDFWVVIKSKYEAWLAALPKSCSPVTDPNAQPADVVLVIDSSGSMTSTDPSNLRITAARSFITAMKSVDRTAIVDFDYSSRVAIGLSSDQAAISNAIGTIDSSGGTNIGAGVQSAFQILKDTSNNSKLQAIFLLTDGVGNYTDSLTAEAAAAGIKIFTIGLGSGVNQTLLASIASGSGGAYKQLTSADELVGIFNEFSEVFGDTGKDTDGDGLTDCQETYGVFVSNLGRFVTSDPQNKNSDDDGIEDGEEVGKVSVVEIPLSGGVKVVVGDGASDPKMVDTDGDGVSDDQEYSEDSLPYLADSDGDGLSDLVELTNGTSPTNPDTDGDEIFDGQDENPLIYEEKFSGLEMVGGFVVGYICPGDWDVCINTIPKVGGKLANAFTPFVGNIYDVANAVVNTARGDFVSAGFDVVGVAGTLGWAVSGPAADEAANVAKAARYIALVAKQGSHVAAIASKKAVKALLLFLPDTSKVGVGISKVAAKSAYDSLKAAGLSDESIEILVRRGNNYLDEVAKSLSLAARSDSGAGFLTDWRKAEELVREGRPKYGKSVPPPKNPPRRFPDDFDEGTRAAKEAKTGCEDSDRVLTQISKDVELLAQSRYASLEWHFYASAASGCIGPGAKVRAALVASGIPFIVHLP